MNEYLDFIFVKHSDSGKTDVYNVRAKLTNLNLGHIKWWGGWRRYIFSPYPDTVFDYNCLGEIRSFIDKLMNARKSEITDGLDNSAPRSNQ